MKHHTNSHRKQRGQSLTEVALFLPLFLVLIAGVTEMGQFLLTSNRISTASRASTRFAANGGEDQGIRDVALNSITQTLPLDEDRWDMWAIRGTVNSSGTGFVTWEFNHIYGLEQTQAYATVDESTIREQVLDELQRDADGTQEQLIAGDIEFAGSYVSYDAESILGLETFVGDLFTVKDLNVMRTFPFVPSTNGCSAFPIAVEKGVRSTTNPYDEVDSSNDFPLADEFSYPTGDDVPEYYDFNSHTDNIVFEDASEGDVFFIKQGAGSGNFGWLRWSTHGNSGNERFQDSMDWPGNSQDYTNTVSGGGSEWTAELRELYGNAPPAGYINVDDAYDTSMTIGDSVAATTGVRNANGTNEILQEHVDLGRILRVIVWESDGTGTGSNESYKIDSFILVRLLGYHLPNGGSDSGSWILAEFIRIDDTCGQVN